MDPILDETSLVASTTIPAPARIHELALSLVALDKLGVKRTLRSVRDAIDRDVGGGLGLRRWLYDPSTPKDTRLLVGRRLAAQPYVDGPDGLFSAAEGKRAVEARVDGEIALGAGLAALTDGLLVALGGLHRKTGTLEVKLAVFDGDEERSETLSVEIVERATDVDRLRHSIVSRLDQEVTDGGKLVDRIAEIFPRLLLGATAENQLSLLTGREVTFPQVMRHLRVLNETAEHWVRETKFQPGGVTFSVESPATLNHPTHGPKRDFPTPPGFEVDRWSLHTKLTGDNSERLYFRPVYGPERAVVLIGYFGPHLSTVKYQT